MDSCVIRGSTAIAQAIDDQEQAEGDGDTLEDEEPVVKPSAVMEVAAPHIMIMLLLDDFLSGSQIRLELCFHTRLAHEWCMRRISPGSRSLD